MRQRGYGLRLVWGSVWCLASASLVACPRQTPTAPPPQEQGPEVFPAKSGPDGPAPAPGGGAAPPTEVAAAGEDDFDLLSPIAGADAVVVGRIVDFVPIAQGSLPEADQTPHEPVLVRVEATLTGDVPGRRLLLWTRATGSGESAWKLPLLDCRYALILRKRALAPELLSGTAAEGCPVYERVVGGGALLLELSDDVRQFLADESSDEASYAAELAKQRSRLDRGLIQSAGADPLEAPEPFLAVLREACEFVQDPTRRTELEARSRTSESTWGRWIGAQYRAWPQRH